MYNGIRIGAGGIIDYENMIHISNTEDYMLGI